MGSVPAAQPMPCGLGEWGTDLQQTPLSPSTPPPPVLARCCWPAALAWRRRRAAAFGAASRRCSKGSEHTDGGELSGPLLGGKWSAGTCAAQHGQCRLTDQSGQKDLQAPQSLKPAPMEACQARALRPGLFDLDPGLIDSITGFLDCVKDR